MREMNRLNIDRRAVEKLCHRYDVVQLGVFGSVARGEENAESDIDLLVRFAHPKSLLAQVRVERELSQLFARPVDLVTPEGLSSYLREEVLSDLEVIYAA